MADWNHRDWLILLALTVLAAVLRFYKLGAVPPGFQFDEAYNAIDAALVLGGERPLFLPANAGREVLYTYWQAALAALFGLNLYSLRLASALGGIAAVPVTYLLVRRLLRRKSRAIAGFTAVVLAISLWHLHFSHYGIRVILQPVIFSGVFGFYWLGTRGGRPWAYVISGALAGLSVWNHPTGRLAPIVLIGYTLWLLWQNRDDRRLRLDSPAGGLALSGIVAFLVFLPLGLEFYRHPEFFFSHASEVSVFAERVGGDAPHLKMVENTVRVLGMFSIQGDREWIHNLAGRPVFDPLLSVAFWIGVILWALRLRRRNDPDRDALALFAIWAFVMLFPSILSDDAPNFSRTMPALPALFVAAGLGLQRMGDLRFRISDFGFGNSPMSVGPVLVAGILLFSGGLAVYDYFVRFPQAAGAYYAYDVDKLDAWEYLQEQVDQRQVYLSQLWAEHATIDFLRRQSDDDRIKSLDTDDTIVLPPAGRGALYAYPPEQEGRAERVAAGWPEVAVRPIHDRYGNPLLLTVTLDTEMLRGWPPALEPEQVHTAGFQDGPTLLGMRSEGSGVRLYWRGEGRTPRDLTTFVQLIDDHGRIVGQIDKRPGNGSYPTPAWAPGERIVERYRPEVDACAGGTSVRVQTGWYELAADGRRLARSDAPGETALAGEFVLPIVSRPVEQMQPAAGSEVSIRKNLTLLGYELHAESLQAGAPLTLDLFWAGGAAAAETPFAIALDGAQGTEMLWTDVVAPSDRTDWADGEGICRRVRTQLPIEMAAGQYELRLVVADEQLALDHLTLAPSTRRFDVPAITNRIEVTLDEQIRLLGYEIDRDQPLQITLVWQALQPPAQSYTVFVHILDEAGTIVAQSDALPAGDYATTGWVTDEIVLDTHTLTLPEDVPAGKYRLVAGMYDPVSGQRLPARNSDGETIANDAVPLGAVEVP